MDNDEFQGKQVLITGTSRGIGKSLAKFFCEKGAIVFSISRNGVNINCNSLKKFSGGIGQLKEIKEWLNRENAQIDILINNAGINCYSSLKEISKEQIEEVFETNVKDTFLLSRMIACDMVERQKKGVIINTLSFAASIPSVGSGMYAASKAALTSLTKTMAAEWAPYGIRVNGYSPGVIETEMTKPALEKNGKRMLEAIAMHRVGNTEDVLGAVAFLVSKDAEYITGINLDVSGGKFIVQNSDIAWNM